MFLHLILLLEVTCMTQLTEMAFAYITHNDSLLVLNTDEPPPGEMQIPN